MNKITKYLKRLLKKLWLNRSLIFKNTMTGVASVYSFLGLLSIWYSLEGCMPSNIAMLKKVLICLSILFIITLFSFIISCIFVLYTRKVKILTTSNGNNIWVKYGDMYSPNIVETGYNDRINLVIPVNRCFDTIVDNDLVSNTTNHGRVMMQLYQENIYTPETLNNAIQQTLSTRNYYPIENLNIQQKRKGNLERYEIGAIAEIPKSAKLTYFFLAISTFNDMLTAHTSKQDLVESVQKLIDYCNARSQGYPVVLPILGTGLSRTSIGKQNALNYIISAFKLNQDNINCDFHIIVWTEDKDMVTIKNT